MGESDVAREARGGTRRIGRALRKGRDGRESGCARREGRGESNVRAKGRRKLGNRACARREGGGELGVLSSRVILSIYRFKRDNFLSANVIFESKTCIQNAQHSKSLLDVRLVEKLGHLPPDR